MNHCILVDGENGTEMDIWHRAIKPNLVVAGTIICCQQCGIIPVNCNILRVDVQFVNLNWVFLFLTSCNK